MAEPIKLKGLIVRQVNYGEYDKMLTVLTEEYGKISVSARGVRSMKSKNRAACELLCFDEFVLSRTHGEVYSLSQCECIESFFRLRSDCVRLALGIYMAEVSGHLAPEDMTQCLKILLNSLYMLQDETHDVFMMKLIFDMKILSASGFSPALTACVSCGSTNGPFSFHALSGGILCPACAGGAEPLPQGVLGLLRYIEEAPLSKGLYETKADAATTKEALCRTEQFMAVHVTEKLKTLEYFYKLVKLQ